ncbi:AbrB/MazE/SpoVT family DNA-binding domain-containing protein [Paenibacillus sp. FSL K6-1122]|uniref:AbrB/MazE/SpoVT family DNA-binding domain-containing protein n=1 Tax=Paenibacillus sp. FSL K6-1122 TaxID=2954512 RepID=UPI0030EF9942
MRKDRNTGMLRNVDALGRIVLPMELRRTLGIDIGNPFEYFVEEDERLILRKYRTQECMFCSSTEGLSYFKEYFMLFILLSRDTNIVPFKVAIIAVFLF